MDVAASTAIAFEPAVEPIRAAIAAGDVYQVNLPVVSAAPLPDGADVAALGAALAAGNPAPFSAVVRLPGHGIEVASASPERFLSRRGDRVVVVADQGHGGRPPTASCPRTGPRT